jgi:hypothetical protein
MTPREATRQRTALLESALHYARRGWPVFPLHSVTDGRCSCERECGRDAGKHPRFRTGDLEHGLRDATTDEDTIRCWWATWPDANMAIRTGAESGLVVVDIDQKPGADERWAALVTAHGGLPATPQSLTGSGGGHLLFAHPGVPVPSRDAALGFLGVDCKADGGYIVAPPSRHRTGPCYEWELSSHPDEVPLTPLPAWLVARLTASSNGTAPGPHAAPVDEIIIDGKRNATLASLAGSMRRRGMTADEILVALQAVNQRCAPPLPEKELGQIATSIGRYTPAAPPDADPAMGGPEPSGRRSLPSGPSAATSEVAVAVQLSTLTPSRVDWVWPSRLARGKLTVLSGDPGFGKSVLLLDLIARLSTGAPWPDRGTAPLGRVVLLSAEDGLADTILPRLLAADGDARRVHVLQAVRTGDREVPFDLTRDLGALERLVTQLGEVVLVGVDPVSAYFGKTDSHKDGSMRGVLLPLAALAERQHVAVAAISHLNKETKETAKKALYRTTGSIALVAAARMAFIVGPHPQDPARRVLVHQKNNLAPVPPTLGFRLVAPADVVQVAWDPDAVPDLTADAVLAPPESDAQQPDAESCLRQLLQDGPFPAVEGLKQAQALRLSESTIWRARKTLGIEAKRFDDRWWWVPSGWPWPPDPKNSPPPAKNSRPTAPSREFLNSWKAPPPQGFTPNTPREALEALQQQQLLTHTHPPKNSPPGDPPRARGGLIAVPAKSYLHQIVPTEGVE